MPRKPVARDVDEYIAAFPPDIRRILTRIRSTIRRAAPEAQERISYRIPAFWMNGDFVYFAAFRRHIGLYPPVRGDEALRKAISRYAGEKRNLKFPLNEPIPYGLIGRVVRARVRDHRARALSKSTRKTRPSRAS
jgi:uncharacterized protein YdhG (YjbR/CyaY superfamily)